METETHILVKKAIKGNKNAFEKLVQHHYERIYRTAYLYVHNEEDALDVVQEATYQAYTSIRSLKNPKYFTTWLTRIVIRCSGKVIKKRDKVVPLTDELLSNLPDETHSYTEESSQLLNAIQQLRLNYRTAIILFYYYDYSIKTISSVMEIPENTVKTYLSRGKAELKKVYKSEEDTCHGS
ncbi:RNA polymerase sigma-70 factor (ECF subfamily) [Bacillus mesophilus]|uniref:Sigma-70 family RNA polymerase sigma factor n=1 Tax=Bacillus mesophilus TaxID=1808955 RepID=A0A6M0Q550_9BACI|nr:sigma-70 family RNA polymerase sigma factor [Bacillus mesophilus]MBM7661063.1 RNA polymerase sigma-70 factor (ECF subfamily) [Bacillus mesophilus]NEY71402.1 sigma-70 family RNA polymerase sigma factor [Bacillus mesophilus]